jgi:hypothetical protein
MHDAQQEQTGAAGGHNGVAGHDERAGMRRPRVEEALVWVHWHDEGLNMMTNMAKGGPAGMVGLHHMAITHSTKEEMHARSGKRRRPTEQHATGGRSGEPGGQNTH